MKDAYNISLTNIILNSENFPPVIKIKKRCPLRPLLCSVALEVLKTLFITSDQPGHALGVSKAFTKIYLEII